MAAPAVLSQGTTVTLDAVAIDGAQSLSGVGSGVATLIDITTLASTAKEFRMGLQQWGSFTMAYIFNNDDLGQLKMQTLKDTQASAAFVITMPPTNPLLANNVWTATVYVTQMQFDVAADGVVQGTATFAVTGEPAFT